MLYWISGCTPNSRKTVSNEGMVRVCASFVKERRVLLILKTIKNHFSFFFVLLLFMSFLFFVVMILLPFQQRLEAVLVGLLEGGELVVHGPEMTFVVFVAPCI